MTVLVLNAGSSSLKFGLYAVEAGPPRRLARGVVERIGDRGTATLSMKDRPAERRSVEAADHADATRRVLEWIRSVDLPAVAAVGHRVVHGGAQFTAPTRIDDEVLGAVEALQGLAPLHNAPALQAIRACRKRLGPTLPMVAVFDTAFHATLAPEAREYAVPPEWARIHGVRRYGFHGLSYRSVLGRYAAMTSTPAERATIVALHLGAGASAAAIRAGRSVDTSMGFTPLEGLVMGSRAGDIDPSVVAHLARGARVDPGEVVRWLNERAGLLGVSGRSADVRDLLTADDPRAQLALRMFCYRARKYLGAYLAVLGGAEAVVFTGGVGEHVPEVRAEICRGMQWCGLTIDDARNRATVGTAGRISADGAGIAAFVIPSDEERVIVEDTVACLGPSPAAPSTGRADG